MGLNIVIASMKALMALALVSEYDTHNFVIVLTFHLLLAEQNLLPFIFTILGRKIYKAVLSYHGKLVNSMFPPHNMTPIFLTDGHWLRISSVLNNAAATDAPAEASTTSFILSATIFMACFISSSVTVITQSSINSQSIGKVR